MRNLNFGCFDQVVEGWVNADITPHLFLARIPFAAFLSYHLGLITSERYEQHRQGVFDSVRYLNLRKPFPFRDNSFDNAFSAHVLEHLTREDGERCLREVHRILKPGGVVRLSVPDLDIGIAGYDSRDPGPFLELVYNASQAREKNRHHWMYTEHSLGELLKRVGFTEVRRCTYRQGRCPDLEKIDNRPEVSLFMEGVK